MKRRKLLQNKNIRRFRSSTEQFFERWADHYDSHLPKFPEYRILVNNIVDEIVLHSKGKKRARALELGIGTGLIANILKHKNPSLEIYGVDVSEKMLSILRKKLPGKITLLKGRMEDMNFQKNSFDVIYANFALHHSEQKALVLNKVKDFLKPGGLFILGEVVVDVEPEKKIAFAEHVIKRWTYTAKHAMKHSGPKAALTEAEVMAMVLARKGEYLETPKKWESFIRESGLKLVKHKVIDENLGYHLFVAKK